MNSFFNPTRFIGWRFFMPSGTPRQWIFIFFSPNLFSNISKQWLYITVCVPEVSPRDELPTHLYAHELRVPPFFSMAYYTAGFFSERIDVCETVCFTLLFWKTLWCIGIIDLSSSLLLETSKLQVLYYTLTDNLLPNLATKFSRGQ